MLVADCEIAWSINSANLLVAPIIFVGRTALSVDIKTNDSTLDSTAASTQTLVPFMLLTTASNGFSSTSGTCL